MKHRRVCLLGGTGFVGRHLVPALSRQGIEVTVISRHPHRHRNLTVNIGCRVIEADVFDKEQLAKAFAGHDTVINLIGILNERKKNDFRKVHVELIDKVSSACRQAGIVRLLHMSAINANAGSGQSHYLRTKGEGENRAHTGGKPDVAVTSFRPSVIFGHDDSFINRFASLLNIPGPMPLACPDSKFAPVFIDDVCQAMVNSLDNRKTFGQRYELCGPDVITLKDLVKYIAKNLGKKKIIIGLSDGLSQMQASILEKLPGKAFTYDNYLSLQQDSVCSGDDPGFADLAIKPVSMDSVVPDFLKGVSEKSRYMDLRKTV